MMILTALFGFLAPLVPELLKLVGRGQDHRQEIELMRLRLEAGKAEHLWRMEEVNARADIEEARELHRPQPSLGIQLLDKASTATGVRQWALTIAFVAYALLDWLTGMVRPAVTYAMLSFYLFYKLARLELMQRVSDESFAWYDGVVALWEEQDWQVLVLVLSYWFGSRVAQYAFGKHDRAPR